MKSVSERPLISVIMAAHNEERSLEKAIQSVIDQTYLNWELMLVDDGSRDATWEIISRMAEREDRIRPVRNSENLGLARCLNLAIDKARGSLLARMDADDVSLPTRLERQVEEFLADQDLAVLGSNAFMTDESGNRIGSTDMPLQAEEIHQKIVRMNPLIHPSVMYRREFIQAMGGYDARLRRKQDYDLWLRGSGRWRYRNINAELIEYRVRKTQTFKSDCYGFYVRLLNALRMPAHRLPLAIYWAIVVFGINQARRLGYVQRAVRKNKI